MAPTAELMEKLLRRRRQLAESLQDQDVAMDENDGDLGHRAPHEGFSKEAPFTVERRTGATFGAESPGKLPAHRCASWEAAPTKRRQPLQVIENQSSNDGSKDEPHKCRWVNEDSWPESVDKPSMTPAQATPGSPLLREQAASTPTLEEKAADRSAGDFDNLPASVDGPAGAKWQTMECEVASLRDGCFEAHHQLNAQSPQIVLDLATDDMDEKVVKADHTDDAAQQDINGHLGKDALHEDEEWSTTVREPIEYFMLNHLHNMPEGLTGKLRDNFEVHERLMQRLRLQNGQLRRRLQLEDPIATADFMDEAGIMPDDEVGGGPPRKGTPLEPVSAEPGHPEGALSEVARRLLEARDVVATPEAEVHKAQSSRDAEARFVAAQMRLARTQKVAEERVSGIAQRVEFAEQACLARASATRLQRAHTQRELEKAAAELRAAEAQAVELEVLSRAATVQRRERNAVRKALAREAEALRYELKAHKARASKRCATERRIQELQRELRETRAELAEATLLRS